MHSGLVKFALSVLLILCCLAAPMCLAQGTGGPADFDYEIYELIDRLNKLTPSTLDPVRPARREIVSEPRRNQPSIPPFKFPLPPGQDARQRQIH